MTINLKDVEDLLSATGSIFSGIAAAIGIYVAFRVHKNQQTLSQRQLLIPLWDHMASMSEVNHNSPITLEIINNVNSLELVALCCEGGMVDEKVIMRTFREQFSNRYEEIEKCIAIPGLPIDGKQLLKQNVAATAFYKKLENDRLRRDQIPTL